MNYGTLLTSGLIQGNERATYAAASDFMLDGERLGSVDFDLASTSNHETFLTPKRHEVEIAAYLLARSGLRNISITTRDERGLPRECPDLDITDSNNHHWGFEVAMGIEFERAQSEKEEDRILTAIREQLDANETLRRALGSFHLFVKLESDDEPLSKLISRRIIAELTRFIVTHDFARTAGKFEASYPTLQSRGAWFEILEDGPHFSVGHGRSVVDPSHRADVVTRVLNNHRASAAKYRHAVNWCAIQISDVFDVFRPTLTRIAEMRPQISPCSTVFVSNPEKRVIVLRAKDGELYVMELP